MKLFWKILLTITILFCSMMIVLSVNAASETERVLRQEFGFPAYIDPITGYNHVCRVTIANLYDPLVFPNNKGEPQPWVAKSWDISPEGLTYTFFLREGIKFHDGTELTAEDVKFTVDRALVMQSGVAFLFASIKNVEVVDKYTVVFHLKNPDGTLLSKLMSLFIINKDLVMANIDKEAKEFGDMGDYGQKYLLHHDAGSGPYIIKEIDVGDHLLMVKNQNYWKKIAAEAPDVVKWNNVSPEVMLKTLFVNREIDISSEDMSLETHEFLDKVEGIDLIDFQMGIQVYFLLNASKAPTDDIHFRKAMAWAFDYESINKIYPRLPQAVGPVPQEIFGHDPTVFQYYRDLDKAKEELKQSKYYEKLDQYPVIVQYGFDCPRFVKLALLLKSNMEDIGITVKLEPLPWSTEIENASKLETSPNVHVVWVGVDYPEAGSLLDVLYSTATQSTPMNNHWLNMPELDAMIFDATTTTDREERRKKYSKIQHFVADLTVDIYLTDYHQTAVYASAYIDLPQTVGEGIPMSTYKWYLPYIKIYPEKLEELMRKK